MDRLSSEVAKNLTYVNKDEFRAALNERKFDLKARKTWKYGCSRGITSVPTYFGNDFLIPAFSWSAQDWINFVEQYGKLDSITTENNRQEKV